MTRRAPDTLPEFSFRPAAALLRLAFAAPFFLASPAGLAQSSLTVLNPAPGPYQPLNVSADGTTVVGFEGNGCSGVMSFCLQDPFRWSEAEGMVSLGTLNGGDRSWMQPHGVSADGAVVVGGAPDGAAGNAYRAFRWTQTGGLVSLGTLNGGDSSSAHGVSADGAVVVGTATDGAAGNAWRAFRWTQAGGMVSLGTLNGGDSSGAVGVSADGAVVVGAAADGAAGNAWRAFRWTQTGGLVSLGTLNGGNSSWANGVSADGAVVVGDALDGAAGNAYRAFRWTQAGGMVSLGTLNGGDSSSAYGISADGKVVVGRAADGAAGNALRAFRWTQAGGLQTVEAWLGANGVSLPAGVSTHMATGTNGDGSVVVGSLENNGPHPWDGNGFIARVSPTGSGLVTLAEVQTSLGAAATGGSMVLAAAGTVLGGAHSQPLMRRVGAGQKTVWVAGDWGRDDHGQRNGSLGLAEIGGGWNFGAAQLNLSAGQTWARQSMALGGRAAIDGNYLLAEALVPVRGDLWATFGGYGHWGRSDLKRAYLNAGTQTASKGTPEVDTWGVRARLDWENAATLAGTRLTPYADLSYAQTRLEGYTETGGGFPARFDARRDRSTELRLGANANKPVGGNLNLVGTLEATHRFERNSSRTVGEVIGLFGFDLPGQRYKQDWLRTGVGVETKIGGGTGSLSLNATTRGEALNMWLAANWQMAF